LSLEKIDWLIDWMIASKRIYLLLSQLFATSYDEEGIPEIDDR
jgi:hypothetical protein